MRVNQKGRCESIKRTDASQSKGQMRGLRLCGLLVFSLATVLMSILGSLSVSVFYATGTALLHEHIFDSRQKSMKLNNTHYPLPTNPNAEPRSQPNLPTQADGQRRYATIYPPHEAWLAPSSGRRRLGEE